MKHLNAEKYNVAWFRLAECVSRGERERALGVYRLLSHSVGSDALAKQLFGDLLLCFDDKEGAIQKYKESAQMYKKRGEAIEAIAVFEHLITLNPEDKDDIFDLCVLYADIQMIFKIVYHVDNLIKNNRLDFAARIIKKYEDKFCDKEYFLFNQKLTLAMIKDRTKVHDFIIEQLEKTLDLFLECEQGNLESEGLSDFLFKLELEGENFYQHACEYLQEKS